MTPAWPPRRRRRTSASTRGRSGSARLRHILPLLASLHEVGRERDRAGNRELHFSTSTSRSRSCACSTRSSTPSCAAAGVRDRQGQRATRRQAVQPRLVQRVGARVRPGQAQGRRPRVGRRAQTGQRRPAGQAALGAVPEGRRRHGPGRDRDRRPGRLAAVPGRHGQARLAAARPLRLRHLVPGRRRRDRADRRPQQRPERREARPAHQAQGRLLLRDRPLVRAVHAVQRDSRDRQQLRLPGEGEQHLRRHRGARC